MSFLAGRCVASGPGNIAPNAGLILTGVDIQAEAPANTHITRWFSLPTTHGPNKAKGGL